MRCGKVDIDKVSEAYANFWSHQLPWQRRQCTRVAGKNIISIDPFLRRVDAAVVYANADSGISKCILQLGKIALFSFV